MALFVLYGKRNFILYKINFSKSCLYFLYVLCLINVLKFLFIFYWTIRVSELKLDIILISEVVIT